MEYYIATGIKTNWKGYIFWEKVFMYQIISCTIQEKNGLLSKWF